MNNGLYRRINPGNSICGALAEGTTLEGVTPAPEPAIHPGNQPELTGGGAGSPTLIGNGGLGYSSYASGPVPSNAGGDPANDGGRQ